MIICPAARYKALFETKLALERTASYFLEDTDVSDPGKSLLCTLVLLGNIVGHLCVHLGRVFMIGVVHITAFQQLHLIEEK